MVTSKTAKIGFQAAVCDFGLVVGLWVVRGTVFQGCALDAKELFPEGTQEQRVPI